jgi:hypothetical protein
MWIRMKMMRRRANRDKRSFRLVEKPYIRFPESPPRQGRRKPTNPCRVSHPASRNSEPDLREIVPSGLFNTPLCLHDMP